MRARRATKYVENDDIILAASECLPAFNAFLGTRKENVYRSLRGCFKR